MESSPQPPKIILASASPRRRRLLELIGLPHEVHPTHVDEIPRAEESPLEFAIRAARDKANSLATGSALPVLGSDTVVEIDGESLGKPSDLDDARRMLRLLSGRTHHVHTAMALAFRGGCVSLSDTTAVRFQRLDDVVIDWYTSTEEPLDKAGAYAVQGRGGLLVAGIDGSPHTVVGLPIHRLPRLFDRSGLDFWGMVTRG